MIYELYLLSLIRWGCIWMLSKMSARVDFVPLSDMFFAENVVTTRLDSRACEL